MKTLSILIPAYNEGENVANLVKSIFDNQKFQGVTLSEIIVVSDGSTDNTVKELKSIKSKKLRIIESKERVGKASRLNQMFKLAKSDIAVVFDADIVISEENSIEKLVQPILTNKADMTSSAICELPALTYFEEVLDISMRLKRVLFANLKDGNNIYNCHGPARAFSKEFYKRLTFLDSAGEDMFSYLAVIHMGGKFKYIPSSKVSYRLPSKPEDHYKQSLRYLNAIDNMKLLFTDDFVNKEFFISSNVFIISTFKAIPLVLRYPTHVLVYCLTLVGTYFGKMLKISPKELWKVASSKNLTLNVK